MSKRSSFVKRKNDKYMTPKKAVLPLIPHIMGRAFIDPCAGDGKCAGYIEKESGGKCFFMGDIEPENHTVYQFDAMNLKKDVGLIITNPPWTRQILHPMIEHLSSLSPTWLLLDADWMHTKQARPYLKYCAKIVSIGRVSWMENGTSGKDNCAWYLFDKNHFGAILFYP